MFFYPFSPSRLKNLPGPWPQKLLQAFFEFYQMRLNFLWCYFDAPTGDEFSLRMDKEAALRGKKREEAVVGYLSSIEAKATSLLQHISIMLALTVVYLAAVEGNWVLRLVLSLEIFGYLWAALACLRCLLQISSVQWMRDPRLADALNSAYELEALKREIIYRHAMQVLVVLTIALALSVMTHSFLSIF